MGSESWMCRELPSSVQGAGLDANDLYRHRCRAITACPQTLCALSSSPSKCLLVLQPEALLLLGLPPAFIFDSGEKTDQEGSTALLFSDGVVQRLLLVTRPFVWLLI